MQQSAVSRSSKSLKGLKIFIFLLSNIFFIQLFAQNSLHHAQNDYRSTKDFWIMLCFCKTKFNRVVKDIFSELLVVRT